MKKITVKPDQSIWDIAMQEYGDVAGVEQLMLDNPGTCSFNVPPPAGTVLLIDETKIINQKEVDAYKAAGTIPATAYSGPEWILESGIWNDEGVWDDTELWN